MLWKAIATGSLLALTLAQAPQPQIDRAAERIKALQKEADELASQEQSLLGDLRKLEIEREIRTEDLHRIDAELAATAKQLEETNARAEALQSTANTQRPDVEARLVQLYKMGRAGYWRLLLDVNDLRAMGRAYRTASSLTDIDRSRIAEHKRTLDALAKERQELEIRAKTIGRLQQQASAARAAVDHAVAARTALVKSIDERRDLNAQLTGELEAAQQKLQSSVAQLGTTPAAVSLPLRAFKGALPWPADGVLIGRFGPQRTAKSTRGISRNGIEISLAEGRPVKSVHEGTVAFADTFTGYGNLVIVDHGDGAYTLYGYLSRFAVAKGGSVQAGDLVGDSGRNPSGNPALYFELRIDGKAVDPLQWLKKP
jgi:septal ring factor EnvC (AmiA/AmiB activator)